MRPWPPAGSLGRRQRLRPRPRWPLSAFGTCAPPGIGGTRVARTYTVSPSLSPSASASPRVICAVNGVLLAALVSSTRTSKPSTHDAIDRRADHTGGLHGAVTGCDRHLGIAADADVVRPDQHAVQRGHRTQEGHHERVGRAVVDLRRRADLLDAALVEHRDPVGDVEGLGLVVGDQHGGDVHLVVQPAQPRPQVLTDLGVQRAERLVEQQHLRDRPPARGPAPCAGAAHRTAGSGSESETRSDPRPPAGCRPSP